VFRGAAGGGLTRVGEIAGGDAAGAFGTSLSVNPRRLPDSRREIFVGEPFPTAAGAVHRVVVQLSGGLGSQTVATGPAQANFGGGVAAAGGEQNALSSLGVTSVALLELGLSAAYFPIDRVTFTPDQLVTGAVGTMAARAIQRVHDADDDGRSDLAVSLGGLTVSGEAAGVVLVSSADLSAIRTITPPAGTDASFGYSLTPYPDLDGDGEDELIAGAPFGGDGVALVALSNGGFITVTPRATDLHPLGAFGWDVTTIGDIDDDGTIDVAFGEPFWHRGGNDGNGVPYPTTLAECETMRGGGYTGNCAGRTTVVLGSALAAATAGDSLEPGGCAIGGPGVRVGASHAVIDERGTGASVVFGGPGLSDREGQVFSVDPLEWNATNSNCAFGGNPVALTLQATVNGSFFGETLAR
jgi:hypothetical protein